MAFFNQAITVLQTLVSALGAGLGIWGVINLLEGYGNDNHPLTLPLDQLPTHRSENLYALFLQQPIEIGRASCRERV